MFKRKKNVAVVLQKKQFAISIPSEVWSEILQYFSRRRLCRQIYQVNRQLYHLASNGNIVPTTHVIDRTFFQTANRPLSFLNIFKSRRLNYIRFGRYSLETRPLRKLPIPGPFIHFRQVTIWRLLGKSILQFLRDAKESFSGSAIHYSMTHILYNTHMRNQMHYLLQNIFQKPSYISVNGSCLHSNLKVLMDGLPNCSRIKLEFWSKGEVISDEDCIRMFLKWLSSGKSVAEKSQRDTVRKHLELDRFNRCFILDLVLQIKEAFKYKNLLLSDFVITFVESQENRLCLEGDRKFILNKISSNERLSFFTHNEFPGSHGDSGRVYRLWHRRVVNESDDQKMSIHLQNLEEWSILGIDFDDREFYDFSYPYTIE